MTYLVRKNTIITRARRALGKMIAGPRPPLVRVQGPSVVDMGGAFRSGDITRLNKSFVPLNYSGDSAINESIGLATARIRDLARNDPAIVALKRTLVDHIIGSGIGTWSDVIAGGELQDDFNNESDLLFEEYRDSDIDFECKAADQDMQRQLFGELLETGEGLVLRVQSPDRGRLLPLAYQVLERDQIDDSIDRMPGGNTNEIRRGIEVDRYGRPVAYYLFDVHPQDPHAIGTKSTRITADRILHFCLPGRPSQSRGIGLYNAIVQSSRDLDTYLGSELTSAIIASLFSVVHKTSKPGSGMGFVGDGTEADGTDDYGNNTVKLGRGIVSQIGREDDISIVASNRPNSQANTFVQLILMLIGMGGGVSRYRITRDYTGTTYIAARAAQLDDRASFRPMQAFFGRNWSQVVRRDFIKAAAGYGLFSTLTATQFAKQPRRWSRCQLQLPGFEMLDEEAETNSAIGRLGAGLSTLQIENGKRGDNWRRIAMQKKRELDLYNKLNVPLSFERPSTPAGPAASERTTGSARDRKPEERPANG
jgi:lambda family phage portal protein